jgi:hypothetical protein
VPDPQNQGFGKLITQFWRVFYQNSPQNCVCRGPHVDALKSGISMVEKKDPTEIAYGFMFQKKIAPVKWSQNIDVVCVTNQKLDRSSEFIMVPCFMSWEKFRMVGLWIGADFIDGPKGYTWSNIIALRLNHNSRHVDLVGLDSSWDPYLIHRRLAFPRSPLGLDMLFYFCE